MCSCPTAGSCAVLHGLLSFYERPHFSTDSSCLLHFSPSLAASKITTLTIGAGTCSAKHGSTTPPTSISKVGRRRNLGCFQLGMRRGKQRWSALVSAPTSRLAAYMRDRLGDELWSDFVRHANRHYKARFVRAFCKGEFKRWDRERPESRGQGETRRHVRCTLTTYLTLKVTKDPTLLARLFWP